MSIPNQLRVPKSLFFMSFFLPPDKWEQNLRTPTLTSGDSCFKFDSLLLPSFPFINTTYPLSILPHNLLGIPHLYKNSSKTNQQMGVPPTPVMTILPWLCYLTCMCVCVCVCVISIIAVIFSIHFALHNFPFLPLSYF